MARRFAYRDGSFGMDQTAKLVTVTIKEGETGMLFATSTDVPSFFVAATDASTLWLAIPAALEDLYRRNWQQDVAVIPTDRGQIGHRQWAIIPRHLITEIANKERQTATA